MLLPETRIKNYFPLFKIVPARLNVAIMLFWSVFTLYVVRSNFSIIILAMVESINYDKNGKLIEVPDYGPRYPWNGYDQSLLLGAFYWGYGITNIPFGILLDRYHFPKMYIFYSYLLCTLLMVLSPIAAMSFSGTFILRLMLGIVTGGVFPAAYKLISKWAPPNEKLKFFATMSGIDLGTVVTWSLCGVLIESVGWSSAFYVTSLICGIFTALWFFLVYDAPSKHPRILPAEREYIETSLTGIDEDRNCWPPILSITTSIPFWSLVCLHYGTIWGTYFFLSAAPRFMNEVLHFNISATGFLASAPPLARLMASLSIGAIGDYLRTKGVSVNAIRKGFTITSHFIPGICLIAIPYVSYSPYSCVAFMTLSLAFHGTATLTSHANYHDLSPNYATTAYSITNGIGTSAGFLSPLLVAALTQERNTVDEWSIIFMIGAAFYIVPAIIFIIFGSTKIQKWNEPA